tara:strand:+ start:16231 stop:17724 length:1494 start_codon:yes stop_codon:yes gene_type:complete
MAIRRFKATKDNTITNAYKDNLTTRGTGSNMGEADVLEVFSLYAQESTSSSELSRVLIEFDIDTLSASRDSGNIPASGSVEFYLRMFNAEHSSTTPTSFTLTVAAISQSWNEGIGLDMDDYSDPGVSNWISSSNLTKWTTFHGDIEGGSFHTGSAAVTSSQFFTNGTEDLEVDVTRHVEEWLNNKTGSYGFGVFLTSSLENAESSYYTKKFFARDSQYFLKRPVLEARWSDARFDDSSNFYLSSSRVPAADNLNKIYLYNYVRGQLQDIPGLGTDNKIYVSIYSGSDSAPAGSKITLPIGGGVVTNLDNNVTGSKVTTGIYSASFAYTSSAITEIYPVWHSASTEYLTASAITVNSFETQTSYPINSYKTSITNLQAEYGETDVAHFRVFVQNKNFEATVYTVASTAVEPTIIEQMFYKVQRYVDEEVVINYGTGSGEGAYTQLSYDSAGNYFDLDMSVLEPDFSYQISFLINDAGNYYELKDKFKFRVIDENDLPG